MTDLTDAELAEWADNHAQCGNECQKARVIAELQHWRATHIRGANVCYATFPVPQATTTTVGPVRPPEGAHGPEGAKDE